MRLATDGEEELGGDDGGEECGEAAGTTGGAPPHASGGGGSPESGGGSLARGGHWDVHYRPVWRRPCGGGAKVGGASTQVQGGYYGEL